MSTFLSDRNLKQWKLFHKMYIHFIYHTIAILINYSKLKTMYTCNLLFFKVYVLSYKSLQSYIFGYSMQ